jgi:hypothetical protein
MTSRSSGVITYDNAYALMMRRCEEVLPEGAMLESQYEQVVDDIEGKPAGCSRIAASNGMTDA